MKFFYMLKQEYHKNLWRTTTYKRENGTKFKVNIPICQEKGKFWKKYYNEDAEYEMALKLAEE